MFGIEIDMCRVPMNIIRLYDLNEFQGDSIHEQFESLSEPDSEFIVSRAEIETNRAMLPPSADVVIYDDGDTIRVIGNKIKDVIHYGLAHGVLTAIDNLLENGSNDEIHEFAMFVRAWWPSFSDALTPRGVCRVVQFYCDPPCEHQTDGHRLGQTERRRNDR